MKHPVLFVRDLAIVADSRKTWSPFKRNGKLRVVFYTDPWWKRLLSWLRREPLWHQLGAWRDES